jgi:HAUS augmin-like complex subunit 4
METRRKFNQMFEELSIHKQKADKFNEEVKLKYEHCLNVAFEISKLLNAILNNFRLGFYVQENKERCENKILEFKVLLGKILSSKASILSEVYSEDKLKALKIINDQLDIKSNITQERLNRMTSLINSYNSLGKEFDPVLEQYKQLRVELDRKNFTLNTLRKDNII